MLLCLRCSLLLCIVQEWQEATARLFCSVVGFGAHVAAGSLSCVCSPEKLRFNGRMGREKPKHHHKMSWLKSLESRLFYSSLLSPSHWASFSLNLGFTSKEAHGLLQSEIIQEIPALKKVWAHATAFPSAGAIVGIFRAVHFHDTILKPSGWHSLLGL